MKLKRKITALVTVFVLTLSLFAGAITAFAASTYTPNDDPILAFEATRNGKQISVDVKAASDFSFGSMQFYQLSADEKTTYTSYSAGSSIGSETQQNPAYTVGTQTYQAWNGTKSFDAKEGDLLFTINYECKEDFQKDVDYNFSYMIEELYDADLEGFETEGKSFTVTYNEETTYSVDFTSNGSKVVDTQTIAKNGNPTVPDDPTRSGYTFKGWSTDGGTTLLTKDDAAATTISGDTTFDAIWEKNATSGSNTVDLSGIKVTKTLSTSATAPSEEYEFTFTKVSIEPESSKGDLTTDDMPDLGPIKITTNTSLSAALAEVDFPIGGGYTYTVKETAGTTEGMTYDDTEYKLVIWVQEDKDGNLVMTDFFVYDSSDKKADGLNFTNIYVPVEDLTITKTVEATNDEPYNKDKKFDFSIVFTAPSTTDDEGNSVEFVTNGQKPKVNGTEVEYGSAYDFQLGDGDELKITNIPEGVTYVLTETGTEYYTGTASVIISEVTAKTDGVYNSDVTVNATMKDSKNTAGNEVDVTNEYSIEVPETGITHHNEMMVVIVLICAAAAGSLVISRKMRISR